MTTALVSLDPEVITSLVINGDLKGLNNEQRIAYYNYRCQQAGLDPAAKPFDLLTLNGKQILYANASCTQQLCQTRKLSVQITGREKVDDIYVVSARVTDEVQRISENTGAVNIGGLKGDALANAFMKATTKAIRRTVLAHCGLGMMDESEAETIPGAERAPLDITPPVELVGFEDDALDCPLWLPNAEQPYALLHNIKEWQQAYETLVARIQGSKQYDDATKLEKVIALREVNKEMLDKLPIGQSAKLKAQVSRMKTNG